MSNYHTIYATIGANHRDGFNPANEQTRTGIQSILEQLEKLGFEGDDLIFSGFSDLDEDGTAIDEWKLDSTRFVDDRGEDFLNTAEIVAAQLEEHLEYFPDPDELISELALEGMQYEQDGDEEDVQRIKDEITEITAQREEFLAQRTKAEKEFFETKVLPDELPVYFCGTWQSLFVEYTEDNPLNYASSGFTSTEGFLKCYSKKKLEAAGIKITTLESETQRLDITVSIMDIQFENKWILFGCLHRLMNIRQ